MTTDKSLRKVILSQLKKGKTAKYICESLNKTVKLRTVYNWIKIIKEKNTIEAEKSPGRPRNIRTKQFVKSVKRIVKKNKKKKSARALAKEMNCSPQTILNAIHDDIGCKTYRKYIVQQLTPAQNIKRKQFCCWIRKNISFDMVEKIMFSDEKIFDGDGQFNSKNDVVYAETRTEADLNGRQFTKKKFPLKAMIWVGITFNGATRIVVLPKDKSFDSDFYIEKVLPIVKRDGSKLIGDDFLYQQDGAPCHTSKKSMDAIKSMEIKMLHNGIWPPNSPDLNPLDFFFGTKLPLTCQKKNSRIEISLLKKSKKAFREFH